MRFGSFQKHGGAKGSKRMDVTIPGVGTYQWVKEPSCSLLLNTSSEFKLATPTRMSTLRCLTRAACPSAQLAFWDVSCQLAHTKCGLIWAMWAPVSSFSMAKWLRSTTSDMHGTKTAGHCQRQTSWKWLIWLKWSLFFVFLPCTNPCISLPTLCWQHVIPHIGMISADFGLRTSFMINYRLETRHTPGNDSLRYDDQAWLTTVHKNWLVVINGLFIVTYSSLL